MNIKNKINNREQRILASRHLKIIILFLLGLSSINIFASEKSYIVELLIFSQQMPTTEIFTQTKSQIKWPKQLNKIAEYSTVDFNKVKLYESRIKLTDNLNYMPLLHIAWIQAVKKNSLSTAVQITNTKGTINGFFRLQRSNLLHIVANFEYVPDSHANSIIYQINEKRRFKLNEIHYFDHPKFGLIARISLINNLQQL